jgi:hypothetical protein
MNRRAFFASFAAAAVGVPIAVLAAPPPSCHIEGVTMRGPLTIHTPGPVSIVNCTFYAASNTGAALTFTNLP